MKTLDQYLTERKRARIESAKGFCRRANVNPVTLSRIRNGRHWPTARIARRIMQAADEPIYFELIEAPADDESR